MVPGGGSPTGGYADDFGHSVQTTSETDTWNIQYSPNRLP